MKTRELSFVTKSQQIASFERQFSYNQNQVYSNEQFPKQNFDFGNGDLAATEFTFSNQPCSAHVPFKYLPYINQSSLESQFQVIKFLFFEHYHLFLTIEKFLNYSNFLNVLNNSVITAVSLGIDINQAVRV